MEERATLGPGPGPQTPTVKDNVPEYQGDDGHRDIDMPADSTDVQEIEGTRNAPRQTQDKGRE